MGSLCQSNGRVLLEHMNRCRSLMTGGGSRLLSKMWMMMMTSDLLGQRPVGGVRWGSSSPVRIGCGSGFWGDTGSAIPQLVNKGNLNYLVLDYLSEVTMSLLVAAQLKSKDLGWCPDFVQTIGPQLGKIKEQGIKVVTNAGGVNPESCMKMIMEVAQKSGVNIKVALVTGDNLMHMRESLSAEQCPSPATVTSINAYLGAGPISRALDLGADIVVTGRCTDSALALGPLIHSFKWPLDNFSLMASGSLAGHLIECGAQATGGIFTDWEEVNGWENNGFPIAVVENDGSFLITKPKDTGGLVNRGTVSEQLLYEIGDPKSYILPDVICDFSKVVLEESAQGVLVKGAVGRPPTPFYKAGGTFQDGWKSTSVCPIIGPKAREKGRKTAKAILTRCQQIFKLMKLPDFTRTHIQVLGSEEAYGVNARQNNLDTREAVLWMGLHHSEKKALEIFAREVASAGTGMSPGLTTIVGGRPKPVPLLRFFSYLSSKDNFEIKIKTSDGVEEIYRQPNLPYEIAEVVNETLQTNQDSDAGSKGQCESGSFSYSLGDLAWTRSGDKGDHCNIGVIARDPSFYPYIKSKLTAAAVTKYFQNKFSNNSPVCQRYDVPGVQGLNFLLLNSLDGGGIASLTPDPQGKGYAQMLIDFKIENVPKLK